MKTIKIQYKENILKFDGTNSTIIFTKGKIYEAKYNEVSDAWYAEDNFQSEDFISLGKNIIEGAVYKESFIIVE